MGVLRHLGRRKHQYHWLLTFLFLLFSSASASAITTTILAPQPNGGERVKSTHEEKENETPTWEQKRLGGPGSWPPSCRSKCGWCSPCQPVHVPVQPGLVIRLEYYPEAWRCKCGNKLFMP